MREAIIQNITKQPIVRFSGNSVALPADLQKKVDAHWWVLLDSGRKYFNGEVFTVDKIIKDVANNIVEIIVNKTNYAHFLYSYNKKIEQDQYPEQYKVKPVFGCSLILLANNKIIFGRMGEHTSQAGIYQLSGGGLEDNDLKGNIFDIKRSVQKEVAEELGININDNGRIKEFIFSNLKIGRDGSVAIVYTIILNETSGVFMKKYGEFTKNLEKEGQTPEFNKIVELKRSKECINKFLTDSNKNLENYMEEVLKECY